MINLGGKQKTLLIVIAFETEEDLGATLSDLCENKAGYFENAEPGILSEDMRHAVQLVSNADFGG